LRDAVRSIDGNVPVFNLRTVATLYESRVTDTWLQFFQMVGTMGFIGLALATTGLYGLIAYTVSRRVKEFGIRVAIGASRRDVVWLVERRGLILAGVGIAIGGALTAAATPLLGGLSRDSAYRPRGVRSGSAGVADGQRDCQLCAGTARRGAGSAAGPAERIGLPPAAREDKLIQRPARPALVPLAQFFWRALLVARITQPMAATASCDSGIAYNSRALAASKPAMPCARIPSEAACSIRKPVAIPVS
jgi:hypothetical protein